MALRCGACEEFDVVCKRPDVCLSSFTINMADGCRDFAVVPECFKDRLNDFAENFLVVVDCHGFNYDLYIQIQSDFTLLCGAYWKLFARTHKLEAGDRVRFSAVGQGSSFQAVLLGHDDDDVLDAKFFGLPEVSYDVRSRFHSTLFKNMPDLTDREVRRLCTAIYALDANVGFERELIVQKMTDLDMASQVLVIPCKCKNVLRVAYSGLVTLSSAKVNKPMVGVFTTRASGDLVICKGWEDFCAAQRIRTGSVLLLEVEYIGGLSVESHVIKR